MLSITNLADVDAVLLSSREPSVRCHAVLGVRIFSGPAFRFPCGRACDAAWQCLAQHDTAEKIVISMRFQQMFATNAATLGFPHARRLNFNHVKKRARPCCSRSWQDNLQLVTHKFCCDATDVSCVHPFVAGMIDSNILLYDGIRQCYWGAAGPSQNPS